MNESFYEKPKRPPLPPRPAEKLEKGPGLPSESELLQYFESKPSLDEAAVEIDGGLGMHYKHKKLFHGSAVPGIKQFNLAEEDTVGSGVYFTPTVTPAMGYAKVRSRINAHKGEKPNVVYESLLNNVKIMDLRKDENIKKILPDFTEHLKKLFEQEASWFLKRRIQEIIGEMYSGRVRVGTIKLIAQGFGNTLSSVVRNRGYDGLVTLEGGEQDIGDHESYVIFDPTKIGITDEKEFR